MAQQQDALDHRGVVPFGTRAQLRGARHVGAVQRGAQRAVVGVLQHRQVAGHAQRELPAGLAVGFGLRPRFGQHVGGDAGEQGLVVDVERPVVGRVEHVVVELRRQRGEFLLHRLEPALPVGCQLGAAEAEIAQLVGDRLALRGVERRVGGRGGQRAIAIEQAQVEPEVGVERRDLGEVAVVGVAQLGGADDGVEVAHRPTTRGRDDRARRRCGSTTLSHDGGLRVGDHALDGRARVGEQGVDGGRDVFGANRVEARKRGKIEQRIGGHGRLPEGGWDGRRSVASRRARSSGVPTLAQGPS